MSAPRGSIEERLWRYIQPEPNSGCWLWDGALSGVGYGVLNVGQAESGGGRSKIRYAHVLSYEIHKGVVPEGLELDHICRTRSCCNPDHVEPVTHAENLRRGFHPKGAEHPLGAKTHCPEGHVYDDSNTYTHTNKNGKTSRYCKKCTYARKHKRRAVRRALGMKVT